MDAEQAFWWVAVFALGLFTMLMAVHWMMWMLGKGRFGRKRVSSFGYVVDAFVSHIVNYRLIVEFRHLLAVIVLLIFAGALALVAILARDDVEQMIGAIQSVSTIFTAVLGLIVGYYFGESQKGVLTKPEEQPEEAVQPAFEELDTSKQGGAGSGAGSGDGAAMAEEIRKPTFKLKGDQT